VEGVLAMPWFPPSWPKWATDFNDQAKLCGQGEVDTTIDLALVAYEEAMQAPNNGVAHDGVTLDQFYAYMAMARFIFAPSRERWPPESINVRFPKAEAGGNGEVLQVNSSIRLAKYKPVEQMTWQPGESMLIKDRLVTPSRSALRTYS
jgi:hypothetical protein